ncbi:MAG: 3-deoxy-8-phosphooctulonate synthase [bacterium]
MVKVRDIEIGQGRPLALIAGPCVIESRELCFEVAETVQNITAKLGIPYLFKASFDKANRSSIHSARGPGLEEGLDILQAVKEKYALPLVSDIHEPGQAEAAAEVLDVLQIPAFLSRQTDLLVAAAKTGKTVNVKKGQFLAPWDMKNAVDKLKEAGCQDILLTERGSSFGYNNLVVDFRSLAIMRDFAPVVFDATHSVQLPGGGGTCSSGQRQFVSGLSRAAAALGIDALFLEVHPEPDKALCDGPNMVSLQELPELLRSIKELDSLVKG